MSRSHAIAAVLLLAVLCASMASAFLIDPGATSNGCSGSKNYSACYDELVDKQHASGNTTRIFGGMLSVPWMKSSSTCAVTTLQNGSNCNIGKEPTFSEYCMVSDEHSQVCQTVSMGNNASRMDAMYNAVVAMRTSAFGSLPGWRCFVNETSGQVDCGRSGINGNKDTASDATWRYIDCFYTAANNTAFSDGNRSKYRELANNLTRDSYAFEFRHTCYNSTLGNGPICHVAGAGANVTACGITCTDFQFSGYPQDGAKAFTKACAQTGNSSYCAIPGNLTLQYLQSANYTGNGFRVPPGKSFKYATITVGVLTNVLSAICTNTCSPDQWDGVDAVRAFGWGEAQHESVNYTNRSLPNMTAYLTDWNIAYLAANNNSVPIQYYANGTNSASSQSGYFAQGLQAQALEGANQNAFETVLRNSLAHYSSGTGTWDSAACFGVYSQSIPMRAMGVAMGKTAAANGANVSGGGGGGGGGGGNSSAACDAIVGTAVRCSSGGTGAYLLNASCTIACVAPASARLVCGFGGCA